MTQRPRRRQSPGEARDRRAAIDDPAVVLEAAARFLEVRSRSVQEVRRRLTGAGYRADLVEGAIERMLELGMLDDEAFARAWVESRDRARPRGERAIRAELGLKGVDRASVDLVLGERREAAEGSDRGAGAFGGGGRLDGSDPDDGVHRSPDRAAADRLLDRHRRNLERVADPRQRRQRAYGLLARHGFDPDTCSQAIQAWFRAIEPEDVAESPFDPPSRRP